MSGRRLRVGQAIAPEEFDELAGSGPASCRPPTGIIFPGKESCADGYFYLHDGAAWSFYEGGFLDD